MRCNAPYAIGGDRAEHDQVSELCNLRGRLHQWPSILTAPLGTKCSSVGTNIDGNAAKDRID
jgi:hypothetical protein